MKMKFKIKGLDCANCAAELERAIQKIEGIEEASISFMTERLVIEFEDEYKEKILDNMMKVIKREEPDVTIAEL